MSENSGQSGKYDVGNCRGDLWSPRIAQANYDKVRKRNRHTPHQPADTLRRLTASLRWGKPWGCGVNMEKTTWGCFFAGNVEKASLFNKRIAYYNLLVERWGRDMIDKREVGRRVAWLRRNKGMSQAELAQSVGISAQGVSKWETGAAMPDIELLLSLSRMFDISINELLDGNELLRRIASRQYEVHDGIACFAREEQKDEEWIEWEKSMQKEKWIHCNWLAAHDKHGGWNDRKQDIPTLAEKERAGNLSVARKIAQIGGLMLEIGAGPGGGYMPFILQANASAQILVNDLSQAVLKEWKNLFDEEVGSPNLQYAAFDFCDMPLKNGSIDVICDHGGIMNCLGDRAEALREACRVLKPGGVMVSFCGFATKEALRELPEKARAKILSDYPEIAEDLYEETILAGFERIDSHMMGTWTTKEDADSGIATLADTLGVEVRFTQYVRWCWK